MHDHHTIIDEIRIILPFLKELRLTEGGFGEVSRMTLLSTQQGFYPNEVGSPPYQHMMTVTLISSIQAANAVVIKKKLKVHPVTE